MRIAVLGCGPAGLMSAHAAMVATESEADLAIFSTKRKSPLYGAQYLHQPIPFVSADRDCRSVRGPVVWVGHPLYVRQPVVCV